MTTFSAISAALAAKRDYFFSKYPLKNMAIFGSVSRGDNRPDSDVDIMVEFTEPVGMDFLRLADELETLLGCKVDLVTRRGVKDRYFKHIEPDLKYV
ncbi:MAG: nucleotidyltransferase family protein [Saprospiraceae bacterium]|nr:nucleotidyltransferase family protein [Saprospiraceae bacterium]